MKPRASLPEIVFFIGLHTQITSVLRLLNIALVLAHPYEQ